LAEPLSPGGLIAGSVLMGLAWIGRSMEQVRDALHGELSGSLPVTPEVPAESRG